jgi:DnaJ domain
VEVEIISAHPPKLQGGHSTGLAGFHDSVPQNDAMLPTNDATLFSRDKRESLSSRTYPFAYNITVVHNAGVHLQIPESSSLDSINKARKELSRLVHPDRCKLPGAQEAFVKITEAASALQATAG